MRYDLVAVSPSCETTVPGAPAAPAAVVRCPSRPADGTARNCTSGAAGTVCFGDRTAAVVPPDAADGDAPIGPLAEAVVVPITEAVAIPPAVTAVRRPRTGREARTHTRPRLADNNIIVTVPLRKWLKLMV